MNALEAAGQGMEILYSTRAWLLAGLALLGVELFIPNGYALALGIAAAMVGTMVWATGEYEWAAQITQTLHVLWPLAAWALCSAGALWALRRMTNPKGKAKAQDINTY